MAGTSGESASKSGDPSPEPRLNLRTNEPTNHFLFFSRPHRTRTTTVKSLTQTCRTLSHSIRLFRPERDTRGDHQTASASILSQSVAPARVLMHADRPKPSPRCPGQLPSEPWPSHLLVGLNMLTISGCQISPFEPHILTVLSTRCPFQPAQARCTAMHATHSSPHPTRRGWARLGCAGACKSRILASEGCELLLWNLAASLAAWVLVVPYKSCGVACHFHRHFYHYSLPCSVPLHVLVNSVGHLRHGVDVRNVG